MGFRCVAHFGDGYAERDEDEEEPEEGRPGVEHVDAGNEDAGEDADGGEFVSCEAVGHEADDGGELQDVGAEEEGEVHGGRPADIFWGVWLNVG